MFPISDTCAIAMISNPVPNAILRPLLVVAVVHFVTFSPARASAQAFEAVGTRAAGMGHAFVAVADDATATWWNPAGLPGSLIFDATLEWAALNADRDAPIDKAGNAGQSRTVGLAVAFPVAGASYVRHRQWRIEPPTVGLPAGRQSGGRDPTARALLTHHVGVSLAQSVGDAVVVGVTARVIRGSVSVVQAAGTAGDAFERAADAPSTGSTRGDVDAGVLVRLSRVRLGLAARNLAAPAFDVDAGVGGTSSPRQRWRLERRVRVGIAVVGDADRPGRQPWTVSADADLTTDDEVPGGWRGVGAGAERWFGGRRVAVRGGVDGSTAGDARAAGTGGVSVQVPGGWLLEASGALGARERRGWGLTAHVMF
jgi:hypothetical protein